VVQAAEPVFRSDQLYPRCIMNAGFDKRLTLVAFLLGVIAIGVCASWLHDEKISIRHRSVRNPPSLSGEGLMVWEITEDHAVFYPLTIAWGMLGLAMVVLSAMTFLKREALLAKLSAYSCMAVLLLALATVGIAMMVGS
jgi:hypothetical protein